ncbi:MAG: class I SAM-dependent rRNA methyltransferase [Thermodesulfovibrio sp.]|uniref:class I SAM-dependent rRNA methyltransferase n=1 Tax=unclassified Thermodesulfovibrio TaxID=2645936 RepID=UPI00083A8191|nr:MULTISPECIES: class I SAM-dependent rRNA methyltransferase [unclassified Thermodesulfovibrio]MDI1472392.1 class I SAM-dependent rRNA methyltransferase [Thermodesulfovibrio sp. 1176]MDI6714257.1 class I SAM-dependent rRNA methyltransferase [Thermodesulfovibrio sp.]ODA43542.1 LSU m5C1962 methyltransferase RlmI [Thermodesulfovibrio sp. N1]
MEKIFVKPSKRYGSLWIYKNEIVSDISNLYSGTLVKVYESKSNKFIGVGYINPKSTISIRLLSFKELTIDEQFFRSRIIQCKQYREEFLGLKENYRLIFSESDFLPGLIVDKYNKCLVIQILTAGMENFKEMIIKILDTIFSPEIIILRNDSHSRLKEGLKLEKTIVKGDLNEFPLIIEDDIKFLFDPLHGQKTGFFLDQRENRIFLKNLITKGEGLDLFCYVGSWSLHMAKKGIKITGIDSSQNAIDLAKENAKINNLIDKSQFIKADVFDYLKWEIKKDKKYDLIVVDPPAFVKSKNEKKDALEGYLNLNTLAIKLLKKEGIIATSSCSQHVSDYDFYEVIKEAFLRNKKTGKLIYRGTQSKDHPILLSMPETSYLKCLIIKLFD